MKKFFLAAAALLVGAVVFTSCSSNSPKSVADKFLNAFYHMDYEEAKKWSTDETKGQMDMMSQMVGMMGDTAKEAAKKIVVDIKDVKEEGDAATVTYTIKEAAGKEASAAGTQTLKMVKQKGKWLASWSKQDMMGGENAPAADPNMGMEPVDPAAAPMDPATVPLDTPMAP